MIYEFKWKYTLPLLYFINAEICIYDISLHLRGVRGLSQPVIF